jgi:phosphoglucomutase
LFESVCHGAIGRPEGCSRWLSPNDPDLIGTELLALCRVDEPQPLSGVAIQYLLTHRPQWRHDSAVGKTLVSSSMIDRVVKKLGRQLREVPVGFAVRSWTG